MGALIIAQKNLEGKANETPLACGVEGTECVPLHYHGSEGSDRIRSTETQADYQRYAYDFMSDEWDNVIVAG